MCNHHGIRREDKSSLEPAIKCNSKKNSSSTHKWFISLIALELDKVNINKEETNQFEEYLAMASYAIQCGFHKTHGYSSGQLVFGRDMFMLVHIVIDWDSIRESQQKAILKSNERVNSKIIHFQYEKKKNNNYRNLVLVF